MNSYRNIPLWENVRRLEILGEFRNDVVRYFDNCEHPEGAWMLDNPIENTEAVQARQRINSTVDQAQRIIEAAGIPQTITWTPPPAGYVQQIHMLFNLFEFSRFRIPSQNAVDLIERAIGVYQSDRMAALCRTLNPLWWLNRSLLWLLSIPFVFLGKIGFDAARAEGSVWGKFFKLLLAASALLTILNLLGWLPAAKALLGIE